MNSKLVSSMDAVAYSRLATISVDALLADVAKLLSYTQVSLVVVCDGEGAMAGVITKTDIVQQIGGCHGSACTRAAADVMTRDVAYCRPTDCLPDVLSMMARRGFVHIPVVDESPNRWESSTREMRSEHCLRKRSTKNRCCGIM